MASALLANHEAEKRCDVRRREATADTHMHAYRKDKTDCGGSPAIRIDNLKRLNVWNDCRTCNSYHGSRSPRQLVLNTVRMQPAMQLNPGILKNSSHSRKPLRVGPGGKVFHKGLRAFDQREHIGCCLRREEFLARHDQIHRRSMGLNLELPSRYGSQPRGATGR